MKFNAKSKKIKLYSEPVYHMRNLVRGQSLKPLQLPADQINAIRNDPDRGIVTTTAVQGRLMIKQQCLPVLFNSQPGKRRRRQKSVPVVERTFGLVHSPKNNGKAYLLLDNTLSGMRMSKTFDHHDSSRYKQPSQKVAIKINKGPVPTFSGHRINFNLGERMRESKTENTPSCDFDKLTVRTTQTAFLSKLNKELNKIINPSSTFHMDIASRANRSKLPMLETGFTSMNQEHPSSTYYKYGPTSRSMVYEDEPESVIIKRLSVDNQSRGSQEREEVHTGSKTKFYMPAEAVRGNGDQIFNLRSGYSEISISASPPKGLKTEKVAAYGMHCNLRRRVKIDNMHP